jgi:hypothetical protein
MRVAAITPLYPPDSRVGAWISTHECLAALVRAGHEVEVCSSMGRGSAYEWEGVTVWPGREQADAMCANADVVVSHFGDTGLGNLLARQNGVPSVQILHAVPTQPQVRVFIRKPPDLVVFVAESLVSSLPAVCRSVVVPSTVWPDEHRTVPGDMVTLVNLCADKGGNVFAHLARRCPDLKFLGVRGGYGKQLEPRLRNVEVIGTTRNMRDDVWARTRVLLMPSLNETSGRVGLEALCSGIPVVCHPTPGLLETQGETGIFVDRDDLEGWVSVVRGLMVGCDEWCRASELASARAALMDPYIGLNRFVGAVEALV